MAKQAEMGSLLAMMLTVLFCSSPLFATTALAAPQGLAGRDTLDIRGVPPEIRDDGLLGRSGGQCGLHFKQHRTPMVKPSIPGVFDQHVFSYDTRIIDAAGAISGQKSFQPTAMPTTETILRGLPYAVLVMPGANDYDPIAFAYAGRKWDTTTKYCSVGAYDGRNGMGQSDCGFTC